MYVDPTGYIAESEKGVAKDIINELKALNIHIRADWGPYYTTNWYFDPVDESRSGFRTTCSWIAGRWDLTELKMVRFAVNTMNTSLRGRFSALSKPIRIAKVPSPICSSQTARGCTDPVDGLWIRLADHGLLPSSSDMSLNILNERINFDAFSVVHEIGHAWDIQNDRAYQQELVGRTPWNGDTYPCAYDKYKKLPGCNNARYFYGGVPLYGADEHFNPSEDFANAVAVYVFPAQAQEIIESRFGLVQIKSKYSDVHPRIYDAYRSHLYWTTSDLATNDRWLYINELASH
jgi:hypothetical protein